MPDEIPSSMLHELAHSSTALAPVLDQFKLRCSQAKERFSKLAEVGKHIEKIKIQFIPALLSNGCITLPDSDMLLLISFSVVLWFYSAISVIR
jgi:hypothetical protein